MTARVPRHCENTQASVTVTLSGDEFTQLYGHRGTNRSLRMSCGCKPLSPLTPSFTIDRSKFSRPI